MFDQREWVGGWVSVCVNEFQIREIQLTRLLNKLLLLADVANNNVC